MNVISLKVMNVLFIFIFVLDEVVIH